MKRQKTKWWNPKITSNDAILIQTTTHPGLLIGKYLRSLAVNNQFIWQSCSLNHVIVNMVAPVKV